MIIFVGRIFQLSLITSQIMVYVLIFFRSHHLHHESFLLEPLQTTYFTSIKSSPVLSPLVFTGPNSSVYTHTNHTLHYVRETEWHLHVRRKNLMHANVVAKKHSRTPPHSPTKVSNCVGLNHFTLSEFTF